jgi:hypothetical protein
MRWSPQSDPGRALGAEATSVIARVGSCFGTRQVKSPVRPRPRLGWCRAFRGVGQAEVPGRDGVLKAIRVVPWGRGHRPRQSDCSHFCDETRVGTVGLIHLNNSGWCRTHCDVKSRPRSVISVIRRHRGRPGFLPDCHPRNESPPPARRLRPPTLDTIASRTSSPSGRSA